MKTFALFGVFALSALAASWTGVISDAACGAKHAAASEKDAKCVTACVKGKGGAAVFVTDGKVLKIADASKDKVMEHLGHKVTIDGDLEGETVTISKIEMAK